MLLFLVLAVVVCQAQDEAVFFPSQPPSFVQLRSLRDILFQKESPETASKELPVVLSSFEPNDPSPTLASPPLAPGVSKIRFLETDTFFVPPPFQESEELAEPSSEHEEQLSTDILPPALIRQAKSAADAGAPGATDRWSWPSGSRALPVEQSQGRALSAPSIVSVVSSHPPPTLSLKKSVAKPYRLLSKGSSCPKLLHDLTIHCTLPPQHLHEPLVFQWYKTRFLPTAADNSGVQSVKVPIAYDTHLIHRDPRYAVSVLPEMAILTIRQLKVEDCGHYTCEAIHPQNATRLFSSEFLIFLCY